MRGLEGKRALVTGAGRQRGIGRAIALRLAEEGVDVAVAGYPRDPATFPQHEQEAGWQGAASVAAEIQQLGRNGLAIEGDVSDPDDVVEMVERVVATRDIGRVMRRQETGGAIVNISSLAGRMGLPAYGAYTATKWAMIGLTQQLALELAGDKIRVNCVCPGSTDTDMMDGTFRRSAEQAGREFDTWKQRTAASVPWGRQGFPEEQAAAVAFLASDDAGYITGQTINVDGGLRMD